MPALRNARTGELLAAQVEVAGSFWQRFLGLMGRKALPQGAALYIPRCQSIHSAFMRFAFDAAFIDKRGAVVHLIHAMRPWRVSRLVLGAEGVVELPAGVLQTTATQLGDTLVFEE